MANKSSPWLSPGTRGHPVLPSTLGSCGFPPRKQPPDILPLRPGPSGLAKSSQKNKCLLSFWHPRGPFPHKIVPALFVGYVNSSRLSGLESLSAGIEDEKLKDVPAQVTVCRPANGLAPGAFLLFARRAGGSRKSLTSCSKTFSWLYDFLQNGA